MSDKNNDWFNNVLGWVNAGRNQLQAWEQEDYNRDMQRARDSQSLSLNQKQNDLLTEQAKMQKYYLIVGVAVIFVVLALAFSRK